MMRDCGGMSPPLRLHKEVGGMDVTKLCYIPTTKLAAAIRAKEISL